MSFSALALRLPVIMKSLWDAPRKDNKTLYVFPTAVKKKEIHLRRPSGSGVAATIETVCIFYMRASAATLTASIFIDGPTPTCIGLINYRADECAYKQSALFKKAGVTRRWHFWWRVSDFFSARRHVYLTRFHLRARLMNGESASFCRRRRLLMLWKEMRQLSALSTCGGYLICVCASNYHTHHFLSPLCALSISCAAPQVCLSVPHESRGNECAARSERRWEPHKFMCIYFAFALLAIEGESENWVPVGGCGEFWMALLVRALFKL